MKIQSNLLLFFLVFYMTNAVSQNKQQNVVDKQRIMDLLEKSKKVYEGSEAFKFNMDYKLFTSYKSNTITETYIGVLIKRRTDSYSRIGKTEFVHLGNDFIKIDNESGLIQLSKNQEATSTVYNLKEMVSNFSVFELASEGNYWVCTLTGPEITFVPYGKAVIYISKTDYTISRQILYLLKINAYKDKDGKIKKAYPRMEINFSDFTTKAIDFGSVFKKENYIREIKNKYVPATKYAKYKIVD